MLSRPPARLASSTRARTAALIEVAPASSRAICSSPSIVVSPSEQIRKTSPACGGDGLQVDLDLRLGAERAGDDRALRVVLGLGVGELALAPHLLDQRVVAGQPLELAAAQPVGAAVADVADRHLFGLGVDDRRGQRRPHPGPRGVGAGELVDRAVGGVDRLAQDLLRRRRRAARRRRHRRPLSRRPRPPGRRPSRRRRRRSAPARRRSPRWRCAGARCRCGRPGRRSAASSIPRPRSLNSVSPIRTMSPSISSASPFRVGVVEQGAVGRVHVLDVGAPVASEDPGVHAGGVAVVDPHVGFGRAADREAADQVEALAGVEAAAALGDQPGIGRARAAAARPGTWWKPVASGAGEAVRRRSLSALRAIQSRKR